MILPPGYSERPATAADVDAIVGLLRACDAVDFGEPDTPREMVAESFVSPFMDARLDTRLILAPDGEVAAYAGVEAVTPASSQDLSCRVHPKHRGRGIASSLLDWGERRARERLRPGDRSRLLADISARDRNGRALMAAKGLEHVRSFWTMERSLNSTDGVGEPPHDVALRTFDPTNDWPEFHRVMEDAFSEHFGFEAVDLETWVKAWTGSSSWQPQLVTLATIGSAIVGGVVAFVSDTPGLGWVADIGVLEAHRGRGIAHVLLMRSFSDLAARGCTRVRLNVDSENASGATRLYDRVGMTVRREWLVFEKVLTHD